jgi:hypothetical protein
VPARRGYPRIVLAGSAALVLAIGAWWVTSSSRQVPAMDKARAKALAPAFSAPVCGVDALGRLTCGFDSVALCADARPKCVERPHILYCRPDDSCFASASACGNQCELLALGPALGGAP